MSRSRNDTIYSSLRLGKVGRWDRLHTDYIMEVHMNLYQELLRKNMLIDYLIAIDKVAQHRYKKEEHNYNLLGFDQSNLIAE